MNQVYDCPYMDDEDITLINNSIVIQRIKKTLFKCEQTNKYIQPYLVENRICDCERENSDQCADEDLKADYIEKTILFQHICDGFVDLQPISVDNSNQNDETECDLWECDNTYTRCNGVWNCLNGADETGCTSYLTINCPPKYHFCISSDAKNLTCLPVEQANDGKIDCFGATDEPTLCVERNQSYCDYTYNTFYCRNESSKLCVEFSQLCDGYNDCKHGDDEQICQQNETLESNYLSLDFENFLKTYRVTTRRWGRIYFQLSDSFMLGRYQTGTSDHTPILHSSVNRKFHHYQPHCHRGLDLRVYQNKKSKTLKYTCLCPPSYYGDQCQFQNQRISLSIRFRALSSSLQTLFIIIISLIDDTSQRIIHSYE